MVSTWATETAVSVSGHSPLQNRTHHDLASIAKVTKRAVNVHITIWHTVARLLLNLTVASYRGFPVQLSPEPKNETRVVKGPL